jgi:hypothetical protein
MRPFSSLWWIPFFILNGQYQTDRKCAAGHWLDRRGGFRMMDAANFDQVETLKNRTAVMIRSIRADDKNRISEAFRNLEPKSVYTRFFR